MLHHSDVESKCQLDCNIERSLGIGCLPKHKCNCNIGHFHITNSNLGPDGIYPLIDGFTNTYLPESQHTFTNVVLIQNIIKGLSYIGSSTCSNYRKAIYSFTDQTSQQQL